jgi:hypothetical protein
MFPYPLEGLYQGKVLMDFQLVEQVLMDFQLEVQVFLEALMDSQLVEQVLVGHQEKDDPLFPCPLEDHPLEELCQEKA